MIHDRFRNVTTPVLGTAFHGPDGSCIACADSEGRNADMAWTGVDHGPKSGPMAGRKLGAGPWLHTASGTYFVGLGVGALATWLTSAER